MFLKNISFCLHNNIYADTQKRGWTEIASEASLLLSLQSPDIPQLPVWPSHLQTLCLPLLPLLHLTVLLEHRINYSWKTCPRLSPLMDSSIPSSLLDSAYISCSRCKTPSLGCTGLRCGKSYSSARGLGIQ